MKSEIKLEVFERRGEFVVVEKLEEDLPGKRAVMEYYIPCTVPFDGVRRTIPLTVPDAHPTFKKLGEFILKKSPKTINIDFLQRKFPKNEIGNT